MSLLDTAVQHAANTFDPKKQRVDPWCAEVLSCNDDFSDLWRILQKLLLFSHGQATLEHGFSSNKEAVGDSLAQVTLRARRTVVDAMRNAGGVLKVKNHKAASGVRRECLSKVH